MGAEVVFHAFSNHAVQFNWALMNLPFTTKWIMRLDADEYLEPEAVQEVARLLVSLPPDTEGIYIRRKVLFYGKWIRFGGFYPQILMRIWRAGKGRVESRWQDAHVILDSGARTVLARGHLVDDNRKGITFWIEKHNKYASREALELLNLKYHFYAKDDSNKLFHNLQARYKRVVKEKWYNPLPLGIRAWLYFLYRYLLLLGFLDGGRGFVYHILQAFWYRLLVDVKIMELEQRSHGNVEEMKRLFREQHGLDV